MKKDKNSFESHVSNERTHLSQVRRAFADGIRIENPDPSSINFIISCCDYLSFSLRRLIEQDHVLHERLIPHVSDDNQEYKEKLNKLETGLVSMEEFIDNHPKMTLLDLTQVLMLYSGKFLMKPINSTKEYQKLPSFAPDKTKDKNWDKSIESWLIS